MTIMACHSNEPKISISWSKGAAKMINDGIKTGYEKNIITLDFYYTDNHVDFSTSSNETWLNPTITISNGKGELSIEVLENKDIFSREGEILFVVQGKTIVIRIVQNGLPKVLPDKDSYSQKSEGGNVEIRVKANGDLSAEVYPIDCKWAKVVKTISSGNNEYAITIDVDKNDGLGRIISLDFKIDGKPAIQDCGPCLIQEPAPFTENLTIMTKEPGSLQILMGNESANLRRIRSLKLVGPINGIDFSLLKHLFLNKEESLKQYPTDIDLSECSIVAGHKNPFEYFGWQPSEMYDDIFLHGEIPSGVFSNAMNLKNIILPNSLKIIGNSAFSGCKNLKRISIPNSVEEINSKAFYGCIGLEEINITPNSCLSSIGNQAFTTKSILKDLTIPITVVNISSEAFLGCSVSKLHLKWTEPFEVRIVPKTEECILFVPKGTEERYRNTRNWSNFKNIIEE